MSSWVYVNGVINVDVPGRTQPEIQYIIETVLSHLPLVTGSEGPMNVYPIKRHGYSTWSSHDEFMQRTNLCTRDGEHTQDRRGGYQAQNGYIIVVDGQLRDRYLAQTKNEFYKWMCRLAKRMQAEDVLVEIKWYDQRIIVDNAYHFDKLFERPSWCQDDKDDADPSWWEYLMWEQHPAGGEPVLHTRKYYADDDVDAEISRRTKWRDDVWAKYNKDQQKTT